MEKINRYRVGQRYYFMIDKIDELVEGYNEIMRGVELLGVERQGLIEMIEEFHKRLDDHIKYHNDYK